MASALKRKRDAVGVADAPKRVRSVEANGIDLDPAPLFDGSKTGWDAAFGKAQGNGEIAKMSGMENGNGDRVEDEGEDFESFVRKAPARGREKKSAKHQMKQETRWRRSKGIGGRMLDVDPVFTVDEKFLIVAHRKTIKVYSTSNSLLNRSIDLQMDPEQEPAVSIVAFALSSNDSNKLWVACSDGRIFNVDWTTGTGGTQFWTTTATFVTQMAVASIGPLEKRRDVIYIAGEVDEEWKISAHELTLSEATPVAQTRTLYTLSHPYQIMRIVGDGSVIIAAAGKSVLVGTVKSFEVETVEKLRCEFMVFESSEIISSLDARVSTRISDKDILFGRKKASKAELRIVDVVVADAKGAIFVHKDLVGNFHRAQTKINGQPLQQSASSLIPLKLHWHRKTVASAKWSLDGNYIISGGSETTLVLWQLDTGHQQFLPHLGAAIANIVVSPSGSSYAIHLADNSTMILSTAELVPTANIAGIQAHVIQLFATIGSSVRRLKESVRQNPLVPRTPAVINPANPSRLILAVGESQSIDPQSTAPFSSQYLQTFDIASNHNMSRQALTRTNVTNINISPYALPISEPIITQMQISNDGSWLATVDEWVPPKRDVESLGHGDSSMVSEQQRRREVHLKFWQWQKSDETWALVNRIDAPHNIDGDNYGTGRVLGLATDPSSTAFSTIGDDGVVLIWRPRIRKRDGVVVRAEKGEAISSWVCQRRISLGRGGLGDDAALSTTRPEHASLAFSEDGSVLAAALNGDEDHLVHLVDPLTGLTRLSRPIMYRGDLINIAFLGQYLIILSDDLLIYDLVLDELRYGIELEDVKTLLSLEQKAEMMHLAVDRKSQTFAVALPCRDDWTLEDRKSVQSIEHIYSEIAVFTPENAIPLYTQSWPALATAVVPAISSPGFIIIDTAAEITSLAPKAVQTLVSMSKPMVDLRLDLRNEQGPAMDLNGLVDEAEDIEPEEIEPEEMEIDKLDDDDDGPPVVSQQQLARIFDTGPSFALPPLEEMFYQVADLLSSKPIART